MKLGIYQINVRTEAFHSKGNKYPVCQHFISYEVSHSKESVLSKVIRFSDEDEIYVLRVSKNTLKDEIAHCEELITYWEGMSETDKSYKFRDVCIQYQRNVIGVYTKMLRRV